MHSSIGSAALALGTTPRMLRYRERVGLLPKPSAQRQHRRYDERAVAAAACAQRLEERYGVGPAALAFALRALADPAVASDLRELGRLCGRLPERPIDALDFEQAKAQRLLAPGPPA